MIREREIRVQPEYQIMYSLYTSEEMGRIGDRVAP